MTVAAIIRRYLAALGLRKAKRATLVYDGARRAYVAVRVLDIEA